jgi:aspartate carbamoyltransferase catalytic subunit
LSEMTSEADAPSHDTCLARCLEKLPQKQGKTAVSNSSRSPVRKEAQSDITEKRERDCDNNAAGKQVTSMQKEETDDTKRQKKLGGSSSKSSSSSSSSHKPTVTVTHPQPSNQISTETAGVSALDGTIEKE